jgi:Ca-activated chloride channel family protein
MRLLNTEYLMLLWVVVPLACLYVYAAHRRAQALARFADAKLLALINTSVSPIRRRWKAVLVLAAFGLLVLAAARPAWNPVPKKLEQRGRDVVFVLDVSKSMLAEDLKPNRLERSKLAVKDCLEKLSGDRVGLVVFSGSAVVKCPLTLDYGFFRMMLDDVSPKSVSRGGTMIGDALRKAMDEVFDDARKQYKDVILITDGEDHDSFPVEAAGEAGKRGIRLIAIGIGDEDQGKRIPITDVDGRTTFLKYQGQEVWSKLDADALRKMVNQTPGGRYLNVATGTFDLGEIYTKLIASAEKKALESRTVKRYEDKFQIFVSLGLLLLLVEPLIRERRASTR